MSRTDETGARQYAASPLAVGLWLLAWLLLAPKGPQQCSVLFDGLGRYVDGGAHAPDVDRVVAGENKTETTKSAPPTSTSNVLYVGQGMSVIRVYLANN